MLPRCGSPCVAPPPPAVAGCSVGPGNTNGASSRIASSSEVTCGRISYSILTSCAAAAAARATVGGHTCDGLADIAHHRISVPGFGAGVAQLCGRQHTLEHVHRPDSGISFRFRGVNREDARVRDRADDAAPVQHAGQLHVIGVSRAFP